MRIATAAASISAIATMPSLIRLRRRTTLGVGMTSTRAGRLGGGGGRRPDGDGPDVICSSNCSPGSQQGQASFDPIATFANDYHDAPVGHLLVQFGRHFVNETETTASH